MVLTEAVLRSPERRPGVEQALVTSRDAWWPLQQAVCGVRCAPQWPPLPGGVCDSSRWERSHWELGCSKETTPGSRWVALGPP